jgi:cytoskeletal protein CcmA (bactofilin family)
MSNPYNSKSSDSVLGPTLRFKGELSAEEDLLILGSVEGSIKHTAKLTVGEQGTIKADIEAAHINIDGKVEGNLYASAAASIRETADVKGDIYAPTVALFEGARFKGKIDMDSKRPALQSPSEDKGEDASAAQSKERTAAA